MTFYEQSKLDDIWDLILAKEDKNMSNNLFYLTFDHIATLRMANTSSVLNLSCSAICGSGNKIIDLFDQNKEIKKY